MTLRLNNSGLSTCHMNLQTSSTVYTTYPFPCCPGMHVPVADASLTLSGRSHQSLAHKNAQWSTGWRRGLSGSFQPTLFQVLASCP